MQKPDGRGERHPPGLAAQRPPRRAPAGAGRGLHRPPGAAELLERIDDETVVAFERLEIGPDGPDRDEAGLRGPSATWTYLVHDDVFGGNLFLGLSNRASIGLWAVLLLWPVLLAWGIDLRWKRRKEREE